VPRGIFTPLAASIWCAIPPPDSYLVLEDQCPIPQRHLVRAREPSRHAPTFAHAFEVCEVQPVDHYPAELVQILRSLSRVPASALTSFC